jgi:uncharacterized protein YjdB
MRRTAKTLWCFLLTLAFVAVPNAAWAGGATEPPQILAVRVVNPDVQKPGVVYVDFDIAESDIGISYVDFNFFNSAVQALGYTNIYPTGASAYGGTVRGTISVSTTAREGTYTLANAGIMDRASNHTSYSDWGDGYLYDSNGVKAFPVPEIRVKDEFDVEMEIGLTNPRLVSKLEDMPEGKTAKILIDSWPHGVFPSAAFDAIKGKDKTVVLYYEALQWVINGKDIVKPTKDVALNVVVSQMDGSEFGVSDPLVSVQFEPNGELPGKATIRLKSDYIYQMQGITGKLYLYHVTEDDIQEEAGNFNLVLDGSDSWCYFDVTHNSEFIISNKKISPIAVTGVALGKTTLTLNPGGSETLAATISPTNARNQRVTWKSDATGIATVDTSGKVTAVKAGKATITVTTADGAKTASCSVTVANPVIAVTGVSLNKGALTLESGKSETLTANVSPANATNKRVTWKSDRTSIATVDASGKVTGVKVGNATITATTEDGKKIAKCAVRVVKFPVRGVSISRKTLTLESGKSETLTALVSPANATNKGVIWKSDHKGTATVDASGKVTGVKAGKATITVTTVDGKKTARCTVTVVSPVISIATPQEIVYLKKGATATLVAVPVTADGSKAALKWKSSAPKTVSVDQKGKIKALKKGTATITATTGNGKFVTIAVNSGSGLPPISVSVGNLPKEGFMNVGDTLKLVVAVNPINAQGLITFKSSRKDVVSVDALGQLKALKKGSATVWVMLGSKRSTLSIIVQ